MPEIIDSMPPRRSRYGAAPRYDWPAILDGQLRRFRADEFAGTPSDFGRQVRRAARLYGVRVEVSTTTRPEPLVHVRRILD